MKDGKRFQAEVETNRGDWQDPYTSDQLSEKFVSLTQRLWPEILCRKVQDRIQNIEQVTDLDEIFSETDTLQDTRRRLN